MHVLLGRIRMERNLPGLTEIIRTAVLLLRLLTILLRQWVRNLLNPTLVYGLPVIAA